jgi:hypothetical protein
MKKIINGKVYDTSTATQRASYNNGLYGDFGYLSETLYLKKTGEFFLHGEGGPMTRYARSDGQNSWTGGERIEPLTYAAAKEWAEEHLTASEYESIFGEVEEDDSKVLTTFNLTRATVEKRRRESQERGMSLSALVEEKLS